MDEHHKSKLEGKKRSGIDSEGKRQNRIMGIKSTETELIPEESVLKLVFLDVPVINQYAT